MAWPCRSDRRLGGLLHSSGEASCFSAIRRHIVQRQHGGSDDPSNLRVLCLDRNKRRPQGNAFA
jgi:hypothetical protein